MFNNRYPNQPKARAYHGNAEENKKNNAMDDDNSYGDGQDYNAYKKEYYQGAYWQSEKE